MYSPFGMNTARRQAGLYSSPYQPQNQQQSPYDFKGLENRLGQIETGIAGLTDQFKNWDRAGQETVDPEYTGNDAPDPLTPTVPTGGISSLPDFGQRPPEAETTTPDPVAPQGPPQPISMADWVRDYEFDMAPQISQSEWDEWEGKQPPRQEQHGWGDPTAGQGRQKFIEDWQENNPEYQRWKEREAGRDPISQETQNIMWGGQHPLGGPSIIPYAQQGKSYEDYMNMVNEAKSQYAETPWLFDQGIQPPEGWKATGDEWQGNPFIQSLGAGIGGLAGQQRNQGETFGMSYAGPGSGTDSTGFNPSKHNAMMQPGASSRSVAWTSPGDPSYTPLSEETYQGQVDLWKSHEQFQSLRDAASHHLGGSGYGNAGMYRGLGMGTSGMGRAFEAWNQFNQSQAGGPYTAPPRQHIRYQGQQLQQPFTNTRGQNNPLNQQGLGAGIGALTGPTQQKIQGYMT